jgi:hypothetical protein
MSELITMCVEKEEMIKAEKSDFAYPVIDGHNQRKIKTMIKIR